MYSSRNPSHTWALLLLLVACSSSQKSNTKDGGSADGGMTVDTNLTRMDGARSDARDSARADVLIAVDSGDAAKTIDSRDATIGVDGSAIDGAADTKGNDAKDAPRLDATDAPPGTDAKDAAKPGDAKDAAASDTPIQANSCDNPIVITLDMPHVDIDVNTTTETHDFDLPCTTGGNDVVLSFYLDRSEMVYADTFGASWDTILALSPTCPLTDPKPVDGMVACSDDACDSSQSQVFAILPNGMHYLVVSGGNDQSGPVTVHFQHAPVGSGALLALPPGASSVTGTTKGSGTLAVCEASGPEDCYWWASCPDYAGGAFTASTCAGTTFDSVLSLQVPRTDNTSCANGDTCGQQELMNATIPPGAGIHVLAVDGDVRLSAGDYTLNCTRP